MKNILVLNFSWRSVIHAFMLLAFGLALSTSQHSFAKSYFPTVAPGTIAYITNDGLEIRLSEPDGSNDRSLWKAPPNTVYGISSVSWRPDGSMLAFTSGHENICSLWHADIYVIFPNGAGLRRVTNNPDCERLLNYPLGTVSFIVENQLAGVSDFIIYIQGANN